MTTQKIISMIPLVFIATAAITSWRSFRFQFAFSLKLFSLAWILMFLVEVAGHVTGYYGLRNQWLYNVLFILWFPGLAFSFRQQLVNNFLQKTIDWFCILFPLLCLANILFLQGIRWLQTLNFVMGGCFLIFLAVAYFQQLYKSEKNEKITKDPFFWFSFGFILYFGGTVPFIGMYNYLAEHFAYFTKFYHLYFSNAFVILLNVLITIGFLCRKDFQKSR